MEAKDLLLEYEENQLKIRELTDKQEALKEKILPFMKEHKDEKLQTEKGGFFEYKEKVMWKYSPETESEEKRIKKLKADEVANGKAMKTFTAYFEYRSPKKVEDEDGLI